MKNIFFNSSMPRSMSTLLQCILNQNPTVCSTPADSILEYLYSAQNIYRNNPEVKILDKDLAEKTWLAFCKGGIDSYTQAYTTRANICIKAHSSSIHYRWLEKILDTSPKMICMVRNLKSIFSSMEKLYRLHPEQGSNITNYNELKGTNTAKRIDIWIANPPVGLALERIQQTFLEGINKNIHYVRAEDLTSYPDRELKKIYEYLELPYYKHDFDNIKQVIPDDNSIYNLSNELNTVRKRIQPINPDYTQVLGKQVCDWIDTNFMWYQKGFGYNS